MKPIAAELCKTLQSSHPRSCQPVTNKYCPSIQSPIVKRNILFIPLLLTLTSSIALADSVITKAGELIEGRVLSESDTFVVIEVPFSETIMEKRTIPRDQVIAVQKESTDKLAFDQLAAIPTPGTALSASDLNELLEGRLRPFIESYPSSSYATDVKARIMSLEAEVARLEEGDIKLFGRWLTPNQQTDEQSEIEAARIHLEIKKLVAASEFGAALNEFNVLSSKYSGTVAYVRSIPLARAAAGGLLKQISFELRNLSKTLAERQQSLDRAGVAQRPQVEAAIAREDAYAKELADRAKASRVTFFQVLPYDEKGMLEMQKSAQKIAEDLGAVDTASLERGITLVAKTSAAIESGNLAAAESSSAALSEAWPKYAGLPRIKSTVTKMKSDETSRKRAEEAAAKEAAAKNQN